MTTMDDLKCSSCGGDRRLFDRVVDGGMVFDYLVCDKCMTRELLQTGPAIRLDTDSPMGYRRIVDAGRARLEASPDNAKAWEQLSRYRGVVVESW